MSIVERIHYYSVAPEAMEQVMNVESYLSLTTIDPNLKDLIRLRISLLNHCAYCVQLHAQDLFKNKETFDRISCLSVWKDTDFYTEKEKSALALAEAVTLLSEKELSKKIYQNVRKFFDEQEYVHLILIIAQANTWNRLAFATGDKASHSHK